jgi:hypothetical protein
MRVRALGLLVGLLAGGCLKTPPYACSSDDVCVLNNVSGSCDVPSGTCLYPAPDCASKLADAHGDCFDSGSDATDDPTSAEASASASMTSTSAATTEPDETSTSGGSTESTTTSPVSCVGPGENITDDGVVGASTVFPKYPPILSVDGDPSTSWFSTGPEGGPSAYTWTLSEERCIYGIVIRGNALHSNPGFREDFGFGAVTVTVLDIAGDVAFSELSELAGTPDPDVVLDAGGVVGSRVVLEFTGHESIDCGGFSELEVTGDS